MKKVVYLLITVGLLLVGCGEETNGEKGTDLVAFDNSDLKSQLEDEPFQPKLPTELPFEVESARVSTDPVNERILTIDFFSKENHLSLMATKGMKGSSNLEFEEVEIGNIQGKYANSDQVKTIKWSEDDIQYRFSFLGKQSKEKVTKEELIAVAESFE
ncbi:DUF4367 domain-containing protein [Virgibacillus kekensis]|uniref:DUF4367 domain-containing protein n=1 Tax=Virgibacillus kekensis TaxID=202261 RepID=A0ABV9DGJ9_9BACI